MSRIWENEEMTAQELERVKCELDLTREGIRAWVAEHRGQLSHVDIVQLLTLAGMKIL